MRSPQRDLTAEPKARTTAAEHAPQQHKPAHSGGGHPARNALLQLQRQHGNRYVQRIIGQNRHAAPVIQTKLTVGPVGDSYEREADRVAQQAMAPGIQRAPDPGVPAVQRMHGASGGAVDPSVAQAVQQARGGGRPVPGAVRERMEQVSGADFSGVRIHADAQADRLNDALRSRAFTVGADVFVRRSEYRPGSSRGDALLAHELTHTIQQGAARPRSSEPSPTITTPTMQRKFGFELELGVPLYSEVSGVKGPPMFKTYPEVGRATDGSFKVHIDHSKRLKLAVSDDIRGEGDAPVIELVTQPMDEFTMSEDAVSNIMKKLVTVARYIKTNAIEKNDSVSLDLLPGLKTNPAGVNFVGIRPINLHLTNSLTVDAYVQQTYGLSLKRVGAEFKSRAEQAGSKVIEENKTALLAAVRHADKMVQWIRDNATSTLPSNAAFEEAHGLFALIAYYLEVGKINPHVKELIKKKFGLFYFKTKLSTVRNQLLVYPGLRMLFLRQKDELVAKLLELTGRFSNEPFMSYIDSNNKVVPYIDVNCGDWVGEILAGTDDKVFAKSKNEYSPELTAPGLGLGSAYGVGVVMENRKFAATQGENETTHKYAPDTWPQLAVDLHRYLRARQGS